MIHKWFTDFPCGRPSTNDAGRPEEVTTPEMIDKIHDIILKYRRVKVCAIVEIVGTSNECVRNTLQEHLDMKKLSARWLPRLCDNFKGRFSHV